MKTRKRELMASIGVVALLMSAPTPAGASSDANTDKQTLSQSSPDETQNDDQTSIGATSLTLHVKDAELGSLQSITCEAEHRGVFVGHWIPLPGIIHGTWEVMSRSTCDSSMTYLFADADLIHDAQSQFNDESDCFNCSDTRVVDSVYCFDCEGVWQLHSFHVFRLPPGLEFEDPESPQCQLQDPREVTCELFSATALH